MYTPQYTTVSSAMAPVSPLTEAVDIKPQLNIKTEATASAAYNVPNMLSPLPGQLQTLTPVINTGPHMCTSTTGK